MWDESTGQYMLTLMDGMLGYIREIPRYDRPGTATHYHGEPDHRAYLERPFREAIAAIRARMQD